MKTLRDYENELKALKHRTKIVEAKILDLGKPKATSKKKPDRPLKDVEKELKGLKAYLSSETHCSRTELRLIKYRVGTLEKEIARLKRLESK